MRFFSPSFHVSYDDEIEIEIWVEKMWKELAAEEVQA